MLGCGPEIHFKMDLTLLEMGFDMSVTSHPAKAHQLY